MEEKLRTIFRELIGGSMTEISMSIKQLDVNLSDYERDYTAAVREAKKYMDASKQAEIHAEETQEALSVIQKAIQLTQQILAENISSTVTLALEAVYENPYEFVVDFVLRRNATECDLLFKRGKSLRSPLKEGGYGPVDIAACVSRVAIWGMHTSASNTIVLDEPFRNLSKNRMPLAGQMLCHLAEKLDIQFIVCTHEKALANEATKLFEVTMNDGISQIAEFNNPKQKD